MANSLTISFKNNPSAIFYPEQIVSGIVELRVVEAIKKARGLRLMLAGEAAIKWTDSSGGGNTRRVQTFQAQEVYLNYVTYLFGSKDGGNIEVQPGVHLYKFTCQLPPLAPYSVEGEHGHVRYKANVNLDIQRAFDLCEEKPFTVARHEDLNLFPELRIPCEFEETKIFCCWFCKSEPLIIKVRLPRTGFGLGEKIPINVELMNRSSTDVSRTIFELKRVEKFIANDPFEKSRESKEIVVESTSRGAKTGESVNFVELLEIPKTLMISNNRYCSIYQITYEIKFVAETGGVSVSPDIHIPVTIGSVGLRNID